MADADIRELKLLADLESIADGYEEEFGAPPINLSLWNPAQNVLKEMELHLPFSSDLKGIEYTFSYELPEREAVMQALGFDPKTSGSLLTHSGSTAIVATANWLKQKGCLSVLIIGPRYFTVPYALASFGINWTLAYTHRSRAGNFSFPPLDERALQGVDAVWLTNPVYCTGVDYSEDDCTEFISAMLRLGIQIVLDECLSECGRRIGPKFSTHGITAIYAPHKAICVNGIKFAAIIFDQSEQEHFDSWCDVWNGCLPISSVIAVRHFLSPDFVRYRTDFRNITSLRHKKIREVVALTSSIQLDATAQGYLISVYAPKIEAKAGLDISFLKRTAKATGAIFIAGARNEMNPDVGLSFRLNLAAIDTAALAAFTRLCAWLDGPPSS